MYKPRTLASHADWLDETGVKIYTISACNQDVEFEKYLPRLKQVKAARNIEWHIDWQSTAAFAIFHDGASCDYLVLVWWGNDNELFTSVSVRTEHGWVEDASLYSFCLYDMEVMWAERNIYIKTMDCAEPSLTQYQQTR
ncbi:hypothetical protein [Colwellia sp. MEBiC06753]